MDGTVLIDAPVLSVSVRWKVYYIRLPFSLAFRIAPRPNPRSNQSAVRPIGKLPPRHI